MSASTEREADIAPQVKDEQSKKREQSSWWTKFGLLGTIGTALIGFSGQYLNSLHTTRVEQAKARLDQGNNVKDAVMGAIERRYHAALDFVPLVGNASQIGPSDSRQDKSYEELFARRFDDHYRETKIWNEGYDKLITSIDFTFDQPFQIKERTNRKRIEQFNCGDSLANQLRSGGFKQESLKVQLAAIDNCFFTAMLELEREGESVWRDKTHKFDVAKRVAAKEALKDVRGLGNQLRCSMIFRVQFFQQQYDRSLAIQSYVFDPSPSEQQIKVALEKGARECNLDRP